MATGYKKIQAVGGSSTYGSDCYCLTIYAYVGSTSDGKATVGAVAYMYNTWESTPYYGFGPDNVTLKITINDTVYNLVGSSNPEPTSASDWIVQSSGNTFGEKKYRWRCELGSTSHTISYDYGTTPTINVSVQYKITGSGDFLPLGDNKASTSIQLPNQELPSFQITFDANNGSGAPAAQTKIRGEKLKLTTSIPSRANYIFAGWAYSVSGPIEYTAGSYYTTDAATTLYAIWQPVHTPVIWYKENGTFKEGKLLLVKLSNNTWTFVNNIKFKANGDF